MTATPDFAAPVVGYRWWDHAGSKLVSPLYNSEQPEWKPGKPYDAGCVKHKHRGEIPTAEGGHRCGVHAAASEESMFSAFSSGTIAGCVEMGGRTMKYQTGWIAETVMIKHLYLPPTNKRALNLVERIVRQPKLACASVVAEVAKEYGVPVIPLPLEAMLEGFRQGSFDLVEQIMTYLNEYGWSSDDG